MTSSPVTTDERVPLLSVQEAARLLALHPMTIRRMIKRGDLRATKIGRIYRVPRSALDPWFR